MTESDGSERIALSYGQRRSAMAWRLAVAGEIVIVFFFVAVPILSWTTFPGQRLAAFVALFPFAALGSGIAARVTAADDDSDARRHAKIAIISSSIGVLLVMLAVLPIARPTGAREPGRRAMCASNLRQIGVALALYAWDHRGRYPATLDELLLETRISSGCFVCPTTGDQKARGATTQGVVASFRANPSHCSYVYIPFPSAADVPSPRAIRAYEKPGNHGKDGMNVLHEDQSVEWLNAAEAKHALAELAAGYNPPRAVTTTRTATAPVGR